MDVEDENSLEAAEAVGEREGGGAHLAPQVYHYVILGLYFNLSYLFTLFLITSLSPRLGVQHA